MAWRRSMILSVAVVTAVGGLSVRADEMLRSISNEETNVAFEGALDELTAPNADAAVSDTQAETAMPKLVEPAGWFLEPGSCSHLDGVGCAPCTSQDCGSCYTVRFVPYGWLFEVYGNATVRGVTAPIDITMRDTLNLLEHDVHFIFMGKLEVESQECGLIVNGFYVNAGLARDLDQFSFASNLNMAIVDIVGTYNLLSDPEYFSLPYLSRFDLLAGVRYWLLDGSVTVTGPLGNTAGDSKEKEWVDPIIGGRIIAPLCPGSELQLRGDVGGFDWGTASEFTWNLEALVAIRCCECMSLRGGYRVLDVNNHRNSGNNRFGFDVQFRGPVTEIAFEF